MAWGTTKPLDATGKLNKYMLLHYYYRQWPRCKLSILSCLFSLFPGEDLVPEPPNEMEEAKPRSGCQQPDNPTVFRRLRILLQPLLQHALRPVTASLPALSGSCQSAEHPPCPWLLQRQPKPISLLPVLQSNNVSAGTRVCFLFFGNCVIYGVIQNNQNYLFKPVYCHKLPPSPEFTIFGLGLRECNNSSSLSNITGKETC